MTRTQTHAYGVVTPSSRQPLLEAMLRAYLWLVSNVVSTFQTIFNRPTRAWHTDEAEDDHLPTPSDITQETPLADPTGLSTGSGPSAASPAKAGVQTPHNVRTRNPSALRALTGGHGLRHMRSLSPRSSRRTSGSRADGEPCSALQLQAGTRVTTVPRFRRLILSLSKDVGMSGYLRELLQAKSA